MKCIEKLFARFVRFAANVFGLSLFEISRGAMKRLIVIWVILLSPALWAQQVPVQEYVLPNGLRFLMIPKKGDPNIAAGWLARAGSVNERPGITGLSHLFEHMMFKGTRVIGTTDIDKDLKLMAQMDAIKDAI